MRVDVVATNEVLWQGEASSVVVPAWDGQMGILPGREPILAVLRPGTVKVKSEGSQVTNIEVRQGFVSVDDDVVTVVVDNDKDARPILDDGQPINRDDDEAEIGDELNEA